MKIDLNVICHGFDSDSGWCWVAPEIGFIPDSTSDRYKMVCVMTRLNTNYSDDFTLLYSTESLDGGISWFEPKRQNTLGRKLSEQVFEKFYNVALGWHKGQKSLIMFGTTLEYVNGRREHGIIKKENLSITKYDEATNEWMPYDTVLAIDKHFDSNVCALRPEAWVECEDGSILLSVYFSEKGKNHYSAVVLRIIFDGYKAEIIEKGDTLRIEQPRGSDEPSLVFYQGRYYLTIRNDVQNYVAVSDDGLHYEKLKKWEFDDGSNLGSYNTKQEWLKVGGKLYLVYTRKGEDNSNVFRHRAPLFIGQVDPENPRVIRSTEQIVVPNRGARLGNFGVNNVSDELAIVSVAEWMQNDEKGYGKAGAEYCASFGSDNSVFWAELSC